jgi:hypothetical protein
MIRKMPRGKAALAGVLAFAVLALGNVRRVDEVLSGDLVRIGDTFKARPSALGPPGQRQ